jgi:hypothetical protein
VDDTASLVVAPEFEFHYRSPDVRFSVAHDLVIDNRVSKRLDRYTQATRNVAALERSETVGLDTAPGASLSYVAVDDDRDTAD